MFITSFEEQSITYRSCSNFRIHLSSALQTLVSILHRTHGWSAKSSIIGSEPNPYRPTSKELKILAIYLVENLF